MKKAVIFVVFLLVIVALILIGVLYQTGRKAEDIGEGLGGEADGGQGAGESEFERPESLGEDSGLGGDSGTSGGAGGGGGGGGNGGGNRGGSEAGNETIIPDDIETRSCGFYFGEYGVCAGTCSSGSCTQEGKSCYCKI